MGHPKLRKRTYRGPTHPWQKERIEEEKALLKEFGLKNKKEVWRVASLVRKYNSQVKKLIAATTSQSEIEKKQLLKRLYSLGLVQETAKIEDVLTITLKDILNRRLQTLVYKNRLAKSVRQARQFITHEHIIIGSKKITSPSYIVQKNEETLINFAPNSDLFSQDHPERIVQKEPVTPEKKEEKKPKKQEPAKKEKQKEEKKAPKKIKNETK